MRASKQPVRAANRAEFIAADYSVGAHVPEGIVMLNVYAGDMARVLEMSPDEARELAGYLLNSADDAQRGE